MGYLGTKPGNSTVISDGSVTTAKIADNAITRPKMGYAGAVLQVVNSVYSSSMTTTSTTFVDSGITATITPSSATSNILVIVNVNGGTTSAVAYRLVRNSTALSVSTIGTINGTFGAYPANGNLVSAAGFNFVDSPATTSATTYKIQLAVDTGTASINRRTVDLTFGYTSSITLLEIEA